MALVANITKRIEIPGESDAWAVIRKLTWKQLRHAAEEQSKRTVDSMKQMGGELLRVFQDAKTGQEAVDKANAIVAAQKDLPTNYDLELVLGYGIASWAYDVAPKGGDVGATGIDLLSEGTAEFLREEIVKYAREGASKNSSGNSIAA